MEKHEMSRTQTTGVIGQGLVHSAVRSLGDVSRLSVEELQLKLEASLGIADQMRPIRELKKIGDELGRISNGINGIPNPGEGMELGIKELLHYPKTEVNEELYTKVSGLEARVAKEAESCDNIKLSDVYHRGNTNSIDRYSTAGGGFEKSVVNLIELNGAFYAELGKFLPYAEEIAKNNPKLKLALLENALNCISNHIAFKRFDPKLFKRAVIAKKQVRQVAAENGFNFDEIRRASDNDLENLKGDAEIKNFLSWCDAYLSDSSFNA